MCPHVSTEDSRARHAYLLTALGEDHKYIKSLLTGIPLTI